MFVIIIRITILDLLNNKIALIRELQRGVRLMKTYIKIHGEDNVFVLLKDFKAGEVIEMDGINVEIKQDIPKGHKVALRRIKKNDAVVKYGLPIGYSLQDIEAGEHVHVHNAKTRLSGTIEYSFQQKLANKNISKDSKTFMGYPRRDGCVGIRNELWIVPTVGCVNGTGQMIIDAVKKEVDIHLIDHIEVYKHNYGCSQLGDDHENTKRILRGLVKHPNCGGVWY